VVGDAFHPWSIAEQFSPAVADNVHIAVSSSELSEDLTRIRYR